LIRVQSKETLDKQNNTSKFKLAQIAKKLKQPLFQFRFDDRKASFVRELRSPEDEAKMLLAK
jgi:hypothetical protein